MSDAAQFVNSVDLPTPKRGAVESAGVFDFDSARNQATVVGSDIVSFVKGVTPERRNDIVRSALLAQLVAKKRIANPNDIYGWYDEYFNVLTNIGWVIQERSFADYNESSSDFTAHEAVLKVAAALLGPAAPALAVLQATLGALKDMSADSPWIRLFSRESQSASSGRFQIMLVEQGDSDQFLVSLLAFGVEATSNLTQVLFFKFRSNEVRLRHNSAKVSIDSEVLESVREAIKNKISLFVQDYVLALPDLS